MSVEAPVAGAAEVVEFWREAGYDKWFGKVPEFDEEIRRRFLPTYEAAAAGKLAAWEADRARRAGVADPARPVSAQHVSWAGARLCHRSAGHGDHRAIAHSRLRRAGAAGAARASSMCRSSIRKISPTRSTASRSTGRRRRRRRQMGEAARRYHPPLRPLPAPQSRARPRDHAGGAGFSRRRRVQGVARPHPSRRIASRCSSG